jgi:protein-tyrosine phosphatase
VIDLHSHVLPGIDDGPATLAESVAIARAAVDDGIRALAATPHVRDDYPTTAERMRSGVAELRAELAREAVPLELLTGGEVALDRLDALSEEDLGAFGLGGNPAYLLVEFPYTGWPLDLAERLFGLRVRGITPVIAHPERNLEVQAAPEQLAPLVDGGALVQVTSASLDGRLGRSSRHAGLRLVELGLAHLVASDAHAPALRGIGMSAAAEAVGDAALARWLTVDVPGAIVSGARVPERPRAERGKRRLRLRFGR